MAVRRADAEWKGNLKEGTGHVRTESGAVDGAYSFVSRFESGEDTNPEELIGAALAGCFSMALANNLAQGGHEAESVKTRASVHFTKVEEGFAITRIVLSCEARVPGISDEDFQEQAEGAKKGCPISQALSAVKVELEARLL
jgi:lipoyl-dependent peroxiredoxin